MFQKKKILILAAMLVGIGTSVFGTYLQDQERLAYQKSQVRIRQFLLPKVRTINRVVDEEAGTKSLINLVHAIHAELDTPVAAARNGEESPVDAPEKERDYYVQNAKWATSSFGPGGFVQSHPEQIFREDARFFHYAYPASDSSTLGSLMLYRVLDPIEGEVGALAVGFSRESGLHGIPYFKSHPIAGYLVSLLLLPIFFLTFLLWCEIPRPRASDSVGTAAGRPILP